MSLQVRYHDGIPYVVTPYQTGTSIREDAFWRQFRVLCDGELSFMEDIPIFGTWQLAYQFDLGHCGLIEDAIALSETCIREHKFNLDDHPDTLGFRPQLIRLLDDRRRLVLAGDVRGDGIGWCVPVASEAEAKDVARQANELHCKASFEAGWDNHCTAKRLHLEADVLEGRLVDRFWREHAKAAIAVGAS